jgi:hypothetical protein
MREKINRKKMKLKNLKKKERDKIKIFSRILKYCRDIKQVLKRTATASRSKKNQVKKI